MKIETFEGGYDKNLCYLIWCEETNIAAVIDPSVESSPVLEKILAEKLILDKIIITHSHFDHFTFLDDFLIDYPLIKVYGYKLFKNKISHDYFIPTTHNEIISIGNNILTVLHTPGHYPDSICLWDNTNLTLFTGDTIFVGRTGRIVNIGGDITELYNSVYNIILKLSGDTVIYPGHHYGFSASITIKENMRYSSFFQCKSKAEFISVMNNYEKNRRS